MTRTSNNSVNQPHLWLRAETKKNEKRTALTPIQCQDLIEHGFKVSVESCPNRIFTDSQYSSLKGCELMEFGTWREAPIDAYIIGLKELPDGDQSPLSHRHIMFAHCYKQQAGWKEILGRFKAGNGLLLDLEFLQNEQGQRVAAFGYYAGYSGAAIGIDVWCHRVMNIPYPSIRPYANESLLIQDLQSKLAQAVLINEGQYPSFLVMGALGRCGRGACDLATLLLPPASIIRWDMEQTARGGPFPEILGYDLFINCIYLSKPIPPFLVGGMFDEYAKLSVLVDVSCDSTNPHNPIPIYSESTTFDNPVNSISLLNGKELSIIAIDHLPTLLPRESSLAFCKDLIPSLLELKYFETSAVWQRAVALYDKKCREL